MCQCVDIDNKCEFCEDEEETIIHLFYEYQYTSEIWKEVEEQLDTKTKYTVKLEAKDVILYVMLIICY